MTEQPARTKRVPAWMYYVGIAVILALVLGGAALLFAVNNDESGAPAASAPPASDPATVRAEFLAAYQRGDTPTMCQLSTGEALSRMQASGWCTTAQGWSTTATAAQQCTTPDGRQVATFKLNPLVLGQRGMEFAMSDTGQGVWRVVLWGYTADRTLCDIYR